MARSREFAEQRKALTSKLQKDRLSIADQERLLKVRTLPLLKYRFDEEHATVEDQIARITVTHNPIAVSGPVTSSIVVP